MSIPEHVWVFDVNHRVYRDLTDADRAAGRFYASGPPIYREHWRKRKVTGQTRLSWLLEHGAKIRKDSKDVMTSEAELDDRCFVHDHAYLIAERVRQTTDAATLRFIAAAVGYHV